MIATPEAALQFLRNATSEGQSTEVIDANVLRATRLMRVFIQQAEVLPKVTTKGVRKSIAVRFVRPGEVPPAIAQSGSTLNKEEQVA